LFTFDTDPCFLTGSTCFPPTIVLSERDCTHAVQVNCIPLTVVVVDDKLTANMCWDGLKKKYGKLQSGIQRLRS